MKKNMMLAAPASSHQVLVYALHVQVDPVLLLQWTFAPLTVAPPSRCPAVDRLTYHRRLPFHPARLHALLAAHWPLLEGCCKDLQGVEGSAHSAGQRDGVFAGVVRIKVWACVRAGVVCSSSTCAQGLVWLATRPGVAGMLNQTCAGVWLCPWAAWLAALPATAWADSDAGDTVRAMHPVLTQYKRPSCTQRCCIEQMRFESLQKCVQEFAVGVGDRRQDLLIIGQGIDADALTAALDACLVTDLSQLMGGAPHDPWAAWPNVEAVGVGVGVEAMTAAIPAHEVVVSSAAAAPPHSQPLPTTPPATQLATTPPATTPPATTLPATPPATTQTATPQTATPPATTASLVAMATHGGAQVQTWMNAAHAQDIPLALLYWHAPHTPPTHPLLTAAAALVHANRHLLRLCCVDVHTHAKNQAFGFNARVLKYPDSHRRGARARPVLAVGHPYPAVSVHDMPALHPTRLHAGPDALHALQAHLLELLPSLHQAPVAMTVQPELLPVPRNPAVQQLAQGAGQLKRVMQAAAAREVPLVVLWLEGSAQGAQGARVALDVVHGLLPGVALVAEGDAALPANRLVATRLGVTAFPTVQIYHRMALHATIAGESAVLAAMLQRALAKLPQKAVCEEEGGASTTPVVGGAEQNKAFDPPPQGTTSKHFAGGFGGWCSRCCFQNI